MSARPVIAGAAGSVRLALVPPPVPPRPRGLVFRFWQRWNRVSYFARFTFLGDVILSRIAPTRMREAAWLAGFALAAGHRSRWQWWLAALDEYSQGNDAGHCVMPVRGWRPRDPQPRRRDRFLPVSRAYHDRKFAAYFRCLDAIAGQPERTERPRLGLVDPARWADDAS